MSRPDLNLLFALDALLAEGSVAGAARRLKLSPSAMSRALSRLRETTGDPLLVRAGREMVLTPRALALREQSRALVEGGEAALRPAQTLDLGRLERTFTLQAREGFVENFGPRLVRIVRAQAPHVRLRFVRKPDKDGAALRDGSVDVETGVVKPTTAPELRARRLFRDRFVGVVRQGHSLTIGEMTPRRYAAGAHVFVSRRDVETGQIDDALAACGLQRETAAFTDSFSSALALTASTDLIATVPKLHTRALRVGLHTFDLPISLPELTISLLWHPRYDADAAHSWLRGCIREACEALAPEG